MQVTLSRSLLVLLACTSGTRAIPTIEMRADNAVNAPNADQMAEAQAHAAKFEEAHQAEAKQFADALQKSNDAAKAAGTNLDISSIFGKDGLDLSGIKLPDVKGDTSASTDTKAADTKTDAAPAKPPAIPYPYLYGYPKAGLPGGYGYPYGGYPGGWSGSSYCYYYPTYPGCSGGGGYNPYICSYYPQYCGGGGGGYFPYPNPYGIKPFEGPTGCGDIKADNDDGKYGFICSDTYDKISYCTVNPSGSFDYQKCGGKGCCGALDDGSYAACAC